MKTTKKNTAFTAFFMVAAVLLAKVCGMLRDICSAEIPFIFRKHIYLIPTLCGAICYALTYKYIPHLASMSIAIAIIVVLRVLAIVFKWNLPVPKGNGEGIKERTDTDALSDAENILTHNK